MYTYSKSNPKKNTLIVDTREPESICIKLGKHIQIKETCIHVGDYLIYNGHHVVTLFERKTISDYYSSILDTRLTKQKEELKILLNKGLGVGLIIEGEFDFNDKKHVAVYNSMNRLVLDGIPHYHTSSMNDTVKLLLYFLDTFNRVSSMHILEIKNIRENRDFRNRTMERIKIKAWKQIPRIGDINAKKHIEEGYKLRDWIFINYESHYEIVIDIFSTLPGVTKGAAKLYLDKFESKDELFEEIDKKSNKFYLLLN